MFIGRTKFADGIWVCFMILPSSFSKHLFSSRTYSLLLMAISYRLESNSILQSERMMAA